jgi:glycosyltransferase involved in cell wall biosynthesis
MKVLVFSRSNLYDSKGGDTVQLLNTVSELKRLGVEIDIELFGNNVDFNKYDLVHFFNIITSEQILGLLKNLKVPFVVSTIFVDYGEYEQKARKGIIGFVFKLLSPNFIHYLKTIVREILKNKRMPPLAYILFGYKNSLKKIASTSAMLLPNSESEYQRLSTQLNSEFPYTVVPNGIDEKIFNLDVNPNNEFKDYILCVGRIEGRKNQLNLIKALKNTKYKLAIIGKPSPNHLKYYQSCKEEAGENVVFINHIEQEKLVCIFKAARVHVLASWFETTGLVSLEAAIMGCAIVITDKGDTREYFKNNASYCEPDNISSIKTAVERAFDKGEDKDLEKRIKSNYTWVKSAEMTKFAYEKVLR